MATNHERGEEATASEQGKPSSHIMEHVKEFGDPYILQLAEDQIMLKLKEPWPQDVKLPKGCTLSSDSCLLQADVKSLVSSAATLRSAAVTQALFAGCVSFESSQSFGRAASEILREAQKIIIFHNRDNVLNLIEMFPKAEVLALLHDFVVHAVEHERANSPPGPLLPWSSQLRELLGTAEAMNAGHLFMSLETVMAVFRACPMVRRIDSPMVQPAILRMAAYHSPGLEAYKERFRHLLIGTPMDSWRGFKGEIWANIASLSPSSKMFPKVEHLEVVFVSKESFEFITGFKNLRSLSVTFGIHHCAGDVDGVLDNLLKGLPQLEKLSLMCCSNVRLSTISFHCPALKNLSIINCLMAEDGANLPENAMQSLDSADIETSDVKMAWKTTQFSDFFVAACGKLRSLRVGNDGACSVFLRLFCRSRSKMSFPCLEELALVTNVSLRALGLSPDDLSKVSKMMPALRHVETDSYDLRLFFEDFDDRRPRVSLSWCSCVHCAVHFPKISEAGRVSKALASILKADGTRLPEDAFAFLPLRPTAVWDK